MLGRLSHCRDLHAYARGLVDDFGIVSIAYRETSAIQRPYRFKRKNPIDIEARRFGKRTAILLESVQPSIKTVG